MNSNMLEKQIIKGCTLDPNYLATLSSVFQKEYFDSTVASKIYDYIVKHFNEYQIIAPRSIIINEFDVDGKTDVSDFFNDIDTIDFDYVKNFDYLFNETNNYLKEKAVKKAILSSVDVINNKDDVGSIRNLVETAISKDLKIDLGINYFNTLSERLQKVMTATDVRVPTGFASLDESISGGLPPYTLSVMVARIHGFKSTFLANVAARQVLKGKNVVLVSLEMSEEAFAQRFDSIFSLLDINKMYISRPLQSQLVKRLQEVKKTPERGNLYIKQYPTGSATVNDYRKYLRELKIRGMEPDIFICDYLNLMKPAYKNKGEMYSDVKTIAEELRALSFEYKIPVLSVSQLNREGMGVAFDDVDFTYISESVGVAATADFIAIFGSSENSAIYESELFYKIVKNRLGGRVGVVDKFYTDTRNLKMYDSSEEDLWLADAKISNDNRNLAEIIADPVVRNKGKKTRRN